MDVKGKEEKEPKWNIWVTSWEEGGCGSITLYAETQLGQSDKYITPRIQFWVKISNWKSAGHLEQENQILFKLTRSLVLPPSYAYSLFLSVLIFPLFSAF